MPRHGGAEVYANYTMNTGGSITRWERPLDAQAALTSDAMQAVLAKLGELYRAPAVRGLYEVVLTDEH